MPRKLTIQEMQRIAKQRGGRCLSKKYVNSITKLKWQCREGHVWDAVPGAVKMGGWCPSCAKNVKLRIEDMRALAQERGGKCLSKKYSDSFTKLKWECEKGHVWEAIPTNIKKGSWCPFCVGKGYYTIKEMQKIAKKNDGRCLSKKCHGAHIKLKWQCSKGHVWKSTAASVKFGTWCPYCAGRHQTIRDMQKLAKQAEGKVLSKKFINNDSPLLWQCKIRHRWKAPANRIKNGAWCPICSQGISERICRQFFNKIFHTEFLKVKPSWMMGTKNYPLELDGYSPKLRLAFEYEGIQHYREWENFPGGDVNKIRNYDRLKKRYCRENGVTLIIIPYNVKPEDMESYIKKKAKDKGIRIPKKRKALDYKSFNIYSPTRLQEVNELAKARGGKCLSKQYINAHTKMKWKCDRGHVWEAPSDYIQAGSWCPECPNWNRTIDDMIALAHKNKGKCLSKRYKGTVKKLKWQCSKGHIWYAKPQQIIEGHWCADCRRHKKTIEQMQTLAKIQGGECLSKRYSGVFTKLKWQCNKGHKWAASPDSVSGGHWCPKCGIVKRSISRRRNAKKNHS